MSQVKAILRSWTDDSPPPVRTQLLVLRSLEKLKAKATGRAALGWRSRLDKALGAAARAWRHPACHLVGRSRYERRQDGMTIAQIAEQDGVSEGAISLSIWQYGKRAGLLPPAPRCNGEVLVTAATLARLIGISSHAVRRLKAKGVLQGAQDGKTVRYSVEAAKLSIDTDLARRHARAEARANALELKCCDCKRVLPRDEFPTITVRDKRCRPGHKRKGPSYNCRDCRQVSKRASDARRRMVVDGAVDPVSHAVVARRDGWVCAICGGKVTRANWSLDHVVPLSKGGAHTYANVVLAHVTCNARRGAGRFPVQAPLFATLPPATVMPPTCDTVASARVS